MNRDAIRIIDPHYEPLAAWDRRVRQCGMRYLRSPAAHSVAPHFTDLLSWARAEGWDLTQHTIEPYARPSVDLFRAHAAARIAESGIKECWVRGHVVNMAGRHGSWTVVLDDGRRIRAHRVVIATGRTGTVRLPQWSRSSPSNRIIHAFDPGFSLAHARPAHARPAQSPVVVGGGTSAVHLALTLAGRSPHPVRTDRPTPVRILSRKPLRIHQFDSDPCFIGPACMERFLSIRDPDERRALLDTARHPGSVPPDLARALESAVEEGSVEWIEDRYPIPDATLQWAPGLYLSGPLAELELGPSAPNTIGAQNAAKRIIAHLNGKPRVVPSAWKRYAPASVSSSSDSC